MRPATRQPYPLRTQAWYFLVGATYRLLSVILAPLFRRPGVLADLKTARILVLKPCCLGDVVFATALVRELRRTFPGARLTFGVGQHSRPAIQGNPNVDQILDTGLVGSGHYSPRDLIALRSIICQERFAACFVLERSAILNAVPLFAGIPIRIGIDSGGRGFTLTTAVRAQPARPESELYLDLLRAIGGRPASGRLEFFPSPDDQARAEAIVGEQIPASAPWVVMHGGGGINPGMVLTRKRWSVESYRELVQRITKAGGIAVVVGAKEDHELVDALIASRQDSSPRPTSETRVVDLIGRLTLGELAALANRATAYVGNDSGPTHLAEAAGARVIMLFGPSDPIVYGPRSASSVALTGRVWCSPCFGDGRFPPCANVLCMRDIGVDRVWRELAPLLAPESARR